MSVRYRVAPDDLSIAQRCGGKLPVPVARMRTDGGTTFTLKTKRAQWHASLDKTVSWLLELTRDQKREMGGNPLVPLPLPPVPGPCPELPFDDEQEEDGQTRPDPRLLGWADEVRANPVNPMFAVEAWVSPGDNPCIYFHAQDRAFIQLCRRADSDGVVHWECRVQTKARELYADGLNLWMVRWLGWLGWMLKGGWCTPRHLAGQGWRTSQWHVNSDFEHLEMTGGDTFRMLGWRKMTEHTEGSTPRTRRDSKTSAEWKRQNPNFANTIYVGRMTSDVCLVVYQKSEQLREAKRVDPAHSMYAPLWERNGWTGGDVTRVELRLRKKALVYVDPETREIVYDLRDPAALLSREAARHVWQHAMGKRRLTCDEWTEEGEEERPTRRWVDPAWMRVIHLGLDAPVRDLRQLPRGVRRMTRQERMAKTESRAVAAAASWGAQHGVDVRDATTAGHLLIELGRQLVERGRVSNQHALPTPLDIPRTALYSQQMARFFREEADAHFDSLQLSIGRELQRVDWSRVRELPQHPDLVANGRHDSEKPRSTGDP